MARLVLLLVIAFASVGVYGIDLERAQSLANGVDIQAEPLCDQCQKNAEKLKKQLEDPEYEKKVLADIERYCNLLVVEKLKQKCKELATKAFRDLQDQVKDPLKFCQRLKLCKGTISTENVDIELFMYNRAVDLLEAPPTCEQCKKGAEELKKLLDKYEKQILDNIEKACNHLPTDSLRKQCKDQGIKAFRDLQERLKDPVKFCQDIKACTLVHDFEIQAEPLCDQCQKNAEKLKKQLEDPEYEKKVLADIEKFCNLLVVEKLKQMCKEMATKAFRDLQEQVKDPLKFCQRLKLCKGTISTEDVDIELFMYNRAVELLEAPPTCEQCKKAAEELKKLLDKYEKQILDNIEKACDRLPTDSLRKQCKDQAIKAFRDLQEKLKDPVKFCQDIKACTLVDDFEIQAEPLCDQCQKNAEKLKKQLEDPEYEKKVLADIEKFCNLLVVEKLKQKCKELATKAFRDLQDQVKDPLKFCQRLKLCKGTSETENFDMERFIYDNILEFVDTEPQFWVGGIQIEVDACDQCKKAAEELKKIVENPANEKKILDSIEKFCNLLITDPLKQKCKDIATKYFRDLQTKLKDPTKFCQEMRVCKPTFADE
jgi:Xaa-Pro aminopeptidase